MTIRVGMKYRLFLLLSIFLISQSSLGSKLYWKIKREIGNTTIWKYSQNNEVRASSQVVNKSSILSSIKDKKQFVEELEEKKRQGLSFLGVKKWQPKEYKWQKNKLHIIGTYEDNNQDKIYFIEEHLFLPKKRLVLLVTTKSKDLIHDQRVRSFFHTASKWESVK